MTDKELIQALRCCEKLNGCCVCPAREDDCRGVSYGHAADRLEALLAENERRAQTAVIAKADGGITITCQSFGWISVEERLPEREAEYIVVVKFKYDCEKDFNVAVDLADYVQESSGYIDNHWATVNDWYDGQQYMHVTHWMPLPELPSTEGVE